MFYKDGKFYDEDFARWACEHNRKWSDSNFFVSDNVGILSNCCFDGNQELYYYNECGEKILTTFRNYVEARLSQKYNGSQIIEKVSGECIIDPNTNEKAEIVAVSKLPNKTGKLIEIELEDGQVLRVTPDQKIFDKNSSKLVEASEILKNPSKYEI